MRQSVLSESAHSTSGWEKVSAGSAAPSVAALPESPSPADGRDLVTGEGEGAHSTSTEVHEVRAKLDIHSYTRRAGVD